MRWRAVCEFVLNLEDYLPYRLATTSGAVSARIAEEYQQRFGLKIPEWRLMAVLGEGEPQTQRQLVQITRLDKVTVNRAAKSLAARDYIARQAHEADGRSHHLALTTEGWALYHEIVPIALAAEARIATSITREERDALLKILEKLSRSLALTE
ncbi:MAG TPA: MarR family winged helix-turn-helix transcriptional regulator [Sphingopyxis sp.]|nr:MarR family winged helix-turn-helix transcriptional regulator [Sphingopyxis sp.]